MAVDRLAACFLRQSVNAVILYGNPKKSFFGVKTIPGKNGINISRIPPVPSKDEPLNQITILGVAGTLWWQGYDRILQGMHDYKQNKKSGMPDIRFALVGGDPTELPEFRRLAEELGLKDDVLFYGYQKGKQLAEIYGTADVGASSLGCYRRKMTHCTSLKAREYCAAALPFFYAYEDPQLDGQPFAIKFENTEKPIDINKLVEFLYSFRSDPSIAIKERCFAEQNYDWKVILKQTLEISQ